MKCVRTDNVISLELEESEKELLLFSLEEIGDHYAKDESSLSPRFREYWSGRIAPPTDLEGLEEANEDLAAERWNWKSERWELVKKWLADDGVLKTPGAGVLTLIDTEIADFLSIVNDRRLLLGIEFSVTEESMNKGLSQGGAQELKQAIWEIEYLACIQMLILQVLETY